jgi:hypothetical protein
VVITDNNNKFTYKNTDNDNQPKQQFKNNSKQRTNIKNSITNNNVNNSLKERNRNAVSQVQMTDENKIKKQESNDKIGDTKY